MLKNYVSFLLLCLSIAYNLSSAQQHPIEHDLDVTLSAVEKSGDRWYDVIKNMRGKLTILYTHNIPFIYHGKNGELEGIEYEIVKDFLDFVKGNYQVELEVDWVEEPSFKDFYNRVKTESEGVLGVSSVSITKARKSEVQFSPPYIPDIEIIISSGNVPTANNMAEFSEMVKNKTAITLKQSTFEENFKYIKKNYFPGLTYDYSPNLGGIMDTLSKSDDLYAYVQITNYGKALDKGDQVKRQRFFMVENPGLAMVLPIESDWSEPVNAYFGQPDFKPFIDSLTIKYLGQTTTTLMNEVTKDSAKVDYKVHLGNEIQLLTAESEIQQLRLKQKELEIGSQKSMTHLLTIGFVVVLMLIAVLFFFYKKQQKNNKELAIKNIEIARTAKSLKKSYRDLELLSEAGKDITSHLTFSRIVKNVWRNIDAVIGVDAFAIGMYDQKKDLLVFKGARENGKVIATFQIKIEPDSFLAAYCFKNNKEVFINDYLEEYDRYIPKAKNIKFSQMASSVIYAPLTFNGKAKGVITVQCREPRSFSEYHLRLMRNLVVYANIALQNAGAFEELAIKSRRLKLANQSITFQKQQIEAQNSELIQLDHEKNHLIGIVAHDLRSPLSSVLGIINLIKMQDTNFIDKEGEEYMQMMETSLHRMRDLITRILDLHKIESREINVNLDRVNLAQILKETHKAFASKAAEKNINLALEVSDSFSELDHAYTLQVFENLVSNAIKFSPRYKCVKLKLEEEGEYSKVMIMDEGPGISEKDKRKLFGRFQRLTAKPTGGEQSVGLGLSIVKKFVDMMGGSIWCESDIGNGATFVVKFKRLLESEQQPTKQT